MDDAAIRTALERHWAASNAGDFDAEHAIYRDDAMLDYPQSGERIRGRHNIQSSRMAQPNLKRFTVRRISGGGDLWISELILTYDDQLSYVVSLMEFTDGQGSTKPSISAIPSPPDLPALNGLNLRREKVSGFGIIVRAEEP